MSACVPLKRLHLADDSLIGRKAVSNPLAAGKDYFATREVLSPEVVAMEETLGLVSCATWFFSSVVLSLASTRRDLKDELSRYGVLLRENERLRGHLAQVQEDNARLRELHGYSGRLRREVGVARDAA